MDVAALSLSVESNSVPVATERLERFSAAATKAGAAAGNQNGSIARLVASVQSTNAKLTALIGAVEKLTSSQNGNAAAAQNMAGANDNVTRALGMADAHVVAYTQHLAGLSRSQGDANAHVLAYRNHLKNVGDTADKTTTAIKFTAREGLNASRQLADIGTTALMGMNPFLIAVQQGPQLFDILQEKAVASGATIGATFRAAGAAIWAAIVPLLPIILPVVAAIGLLTAGVAALTAQANNDAGLKKYTTAMGYTKAEVEKLNAVTVTMGDTAKAVFQVGWARIAEAFGISTDDIAKKWQSFLNWLATATRAVLAGIYASILGTADLIDNVAKDALSGNLSVDSLTRGYRERYVQAQRFFDDVSKQAGANARARQDEMARKFYDAPKGSKSDPLGDILRAAEAEIRAEQARAAAAALSARAAAELEQKTKLLNQIEKAKIPVTDALRAKVEGLAKAYADVKMAADIAFAVQGVTDGLQKQNDAINDQLALVGLYGDELTAARIEMTALAEARDKLPKGEQLSPEQVRKVLEATKPVIRDQQNLDRATRIEANTRWHAEQMRQLEVERGALALTGEALASYRYQQELINRELAAGVKLKDIDMAKVREQGDEYAKAAKAVEDMARLEDIKIRGFDSLNSGIVDAIRGVRSLGDVFGSVADQIIADLLRIAVQRAIIEPLANALFPSGGGGIFNLLFGSLKFANGGALGTAQKFAKGGAFSNQVVNQPTLFRFANGGKIGEMGEAGPEAVMPLQRDSSGRLGVKAVGGGRPQIRMGDVHVHNSLAGAIGPEGLAAALQASGERTVAQIRRDLQAMLAQLDQDGTLV